MDVIASMPQLKSTTCYCIVRTECPAWSAGWFDKKRKKKSLELGVRRSDIRYRYRSDTGIFCRIGYRSDEADPNPILCVYYCVIVKPHKSHKHIIKHHKVFAHYISSVLKPLHSLMWGTDEYLSQVYVNSSLRCGCLSSSIQRSNCVSKPNKNTTVKQINRELSSGVDLAKITNKTFLL